MPPVHVFKRYDRLIKQHTKNPGGGVGVTDFFLASIEMYKFAVPKYGNKINEKTSKQKIIYLYFYYSFQRQN